MKRPVRIVLNVLMPPLLAAVGFIAIMGFAAASECISGNSNGNVGDMIRDIAMSGLMIAFYAYMIAGIPSILHAALMEFVYLKFPAKLWTAVGASTLSGIFAGVLITGFLVNWHIRKIPAKPVLIVLGCIVGFLLGLIIKWLSRARIESRAPTLRGCE